MKKHQVRVRLEKLGLLRSLTLLITGCVVLRVITNQLLYRLS